MVTLSKVLGKLQPPSRQAPVLEEYPGHAATSWYAFFVALVDRLNNLVPAIIQQATGNFFSNFGAVVNKINDRLFVGGATANDGAFPNVQQDWLSQFQIAAGAGIGSVAVSQAAILTPTNTFFDALTVGTQSLGSTSAGTAPGALDVFAVNNTPNYANHIWSVYCEAHRINSVAGETTGIEIEIRNLGSETLQDPFTFFTEGMTTALQLGAGAGLASAGQNNVSMAALIFSNPKAFKVGIVVENGSIVADAPDGKSHVLLMPAGYCLAWYTSAGTVGGTITIDAANKCQITATGGLWVNGTQVTVP